MIFICANQTTDVLAAQVAALHKWPRFFLTG